MPRYERADGIDRYFLTIEVVDGTSVRTYQGRVGAEPRESVRHFGTRAEADLAAARAIAVTLKRGYAEMPPVLPRDSSPAALDALEAKIAENPDDLASCAVYGDWLQERRDPFGEVLALHVAVAEEKDAARRSALEIELETARQSARLFGAVAPLGSRLELAWHLGILQEVRLRAGDAEDGVSAAALLGLLLTLPVGRCVSRLTLPAFAFVDFGLMLPEVVAGGGLRTIRALDVEGGASPGASARRKLVRLNRLAGLRSLSLPFSEFDGRGLSLPRVETVTLTAESVDASDVATLGTAELPRMIRVAVPNIATARFPATPLAGLASLPAVHIVRIRGNRFGGVEEIVEGLAASLPRVDTFELDDIEGAWERGVRDRFPHLRFVVRRVADRD